MALVCFVDVTLIAFDSDVMADSRERHPLEAPGFYQAILYLAYPPKRDCV
jgi:hypothetical protein